MKKDTEKMLPGYTYHVFARTNNKELLFTQERNYTFFLQRFEEYISPIAHCLSYCLLPNHVHFMIRIRLVEELEAFCSTIKHEKEKLSEKDVATLRSDTFSKSVTSTKASTKDTTPENIVSYQFQRLFTSYSKAFNKQEQRYGNLIQRPFKRKLIEEDDHYFYNIYYIHKNPQKHGFVMDFTTYPWSSYHIFFHDKPTFIEREEVLFHFDGLKWFKAYHLNQLDDIDWEFDE